MEKKLKKGKYEKGFLRGRINKQQQLPKLTKNEHYHSSPVFDRFG